MAELVLRQSIPDRLSPRGGFHNSEIRSQVSAYAALSEVDLLFVGSSVAAANYPPEAFDEELERLGKTGFSSFNAGIRGCNYACIEEGLERLYLVRHLPRYVMVVVSPEDLDINNQTVIRRSQEFLESFRQPAYRVFLKNKLSDFIYLYGLQSHLRSFLKFDGWAMDESVVRTRGYVDMGSAARKRYNNSPVIESTSALSASLTRLVGSLVERGVQVVLLKAEGDSVARKNLTQRSRMQYLSLLDELQTPDNVELLNGKLDVYGNIELFNDDDYIDNLHLNSTAAARNARLVARQFLNLIQAH